MITTGLLTVFIWDTLVFDKRDAMVLGPLPLRGTTIVAAKLAALATFLVGTALAVNVTSGVPFAFVTGGPEGHILRHLGGSSRGHDWRRGLHVLARSSSCADCWCCSSARTFAATAGSFLQFVFLSAVLCFMMVPTAMGEPGRCSWPPKLTLDADGLVLRVVRGIRGSRHPGSMLSRSARSSCFRCRSPARLP